MRRMFLMTDVSFTAVLSIFRFDYRCVDDDDDDCDEEDHPSRYEYHVKYRLKDWVTFALRPIEVLQPLGRFLVARVQSVVLEQPDDLLEHRVLTTVLKHLAPDTRHTLARRRRRASGHRRRCPGSTRISDSAAKRRRHTGEGDLRIAVHAARNAVDCDHSWALSVVRQTDDDETPVAAEAAMSAYNASKN